ncbi:hypothetical protein PCASD_06308 [Puccinia coronata f. sp. avenae]|uniref:Uncharacterized protein n=1 Tax=Puccinia coronata f. sp. avenae TaxID=200324 RepID=A0A2N5SQ01_9BASI|nr:hypothetical protein PCASD_18129 [Puccinia coronata f. sp. avenae]PLW46475.1 hypothetical protein PCASD_06308 [Puccinia coronata f. sp. avenae]
MSKLMATFLILHRHPSPVLHFKAPSDTSFSYFADIIVQPKDGNPNSSTSSALKKRSKDNSVIHFIDLARRISVTPLHSMHRPIRPLDLETL